MKQKNYVVNIYLENHLMKKNHQCQNEQEDHIKRCCINSNRKYDYRATTKPSNPEQDKIFMDLLEEHIQKKDYR